MEEIIKKLEELKLSHLVLDDDDWYSCPKSGKCSNEAEDPNHCNCGADYKNEKIYEIISLIKK